MSLASHVPGSELWEGGTPTAPPPATERDRGQTTTRRRRDPWAPISHDTDPSARERRLRTVHRDLALHLSGDPCTGCGATAWLSGGTGCTCPASGTDLEKRCLAAAERTRLDGDPHRHNAAAMPPPVRRQHRRGFVEVARP